MGTACVASGAVALSLFACGGEGFDSQSKVDSVRIFGTRADKPYTAPGETVTLEALIADGRRDKPRPLKLFWIPIVCINPAEDLYYRCFLGGAEGGADGGATFIPGGPLADAGADGGDGGAASLPTGSPLANIPTGIDLSPFLPQGSTFSFRMPNDVIIDRGEAKKAYGLAFVFNIACAGQVRLADRDPSGGPQQVPILCTDEEGVPLSPKDYVIGISRVYSYPDRTNTNPVVERITLDGVDVDPLVGITLDRCVGVTKRADCPEHKIDVKVSEASWEPNPSESTANLREQVWATYYANIGDLEDEARLLFDARGGRISESDNVFLAPYEAQEGTMWIVVHDNRAGAAFVVLPVHVK